MSGPDDKDQRTLAPTGKRITEFRGRGEIALSRDLTTLCTMTGGALGAALFAGEIVRAIREGTATLLARLDGPLTPAVATAIHTYFGATLPIVVGCVAGWFLSAAPQLGWPPAFRWPKPSFPTLFSLQTIMSIVSPRAALVRAGMSTAKVAAVGGAAALALVLELRAFISTPALDAASLAVRLGGALGRIAIYAGLILAPLAIIDYIKNRRALMARMRMTPAEAKREFREQEGDPTNKRRRRQRMKELAKRRVAQAVKGADVVLVNPTEYAVALRYHAKEDRAPRVLAKGRGEAAEHIRALARQAGIPIVPEPPLCRLIYKLVAEGREIPGALYKAVAEVLAYVYRIRRRRA